MQRTVCNFSFLLRFEVVLLHEIAKIPEGEFLTEGGKLAGVNGDSTGQAVEVHWFDDATEVRFIDDAEFRQNLRHEF